MNWEEIIISALKNGEDLNKFLKKAAKVAPDEISLLMTDFPEKIDDKAIEQGMYPKTLSLLYYHMFAIAGELFYRFPLEYQRDILESSIDASLEASLISHDLGEKGLEAQYLGIAANSLYALGEFSEAEKVYTEALQKYREPAKENPEAYKADIATVLNNLGNLHSNTGRFSKAEKVYNEALEIRRTLAKQDPDTYAPDVAMILNNIGNLYSNTHKFFKAETVYTEALQKYRELAKENPDAYTAHVATTLNNLGNLYWNTGRFDEAETVYTEALQKYRELAKENPDTYTFYVAATLNNLGTLYWNTGRFDEAETVYTEALQKYRELAKENPDAYTAHVAMVLNNLGNLYRNTHKYFRAETVYTEALEIKKNLAKENLDAYTPDIAEALNNLGNLYNDMGKFSETEKAFTEALKIRRTLAEQDPDTYAPDVAMILNNIGTLYWDTHKFLKAETVYTEALQKYRELAKENPDAYTTHVATTLNNLGNLYWNTGRFDEAETVYTEALQKYRELARKSPDAYLADIAATLNNLGTIYWNTGRFDEAETVYTEALQKYRELAKENPDAYTAHVAMVLNNLGNLYRNTHKYFRAETVYTEALQKYRELAKENLDAYTPDIAEALNNLGNLYNDMGKFSETEKAFTEALKIRRTLAEQDPDTYAPDVAMILNNIGTLYWDTHKFFKAETVYTEALQKYRELAKENPDAYTTHVATTLNNLGNLYWNTGRFDEAETVYTEALQKYRELAKENPDTYTFYVAATLNNLGTLYVDTQKPSQAEKAYEEALEKYKKGGSWFYAANTSHNIYMIKLNKKILGKSIKLLEMAILFSRDEKYRYAQKRTNEYIYWSLIERNLNSFSDLEALRDSQLLSIPWDQVLLQKDLKRAQKDVRFQKTLVENVLKRQVPHVIPPPRELPESMLFIYVQELRNYLLFFVIGSDGAKEYKCKKEFLAIGDKLLFNLRIQRGAAQKTDDLKFVTDKFEMYSRKWSEIFPEEIRDEIQRKNHIIFSPDPQCSFLPLEALPIDGEPLCMERIVVRATSLHQFLDLLKRTPSFDSSLIVGNPWIECGEKQLFYSLPETGSKQFRISFLGDAEEEAKTLMGKLQKSTMLLEQQATGERFLSEIPKHSLIHFSGHGSLGRILFLSGPFKGFPPPFEPEEFSDLRKAERIKGIKKTNLMEEWHPVTDLDLFDVQLTEGAIIFLNACETGQHKYAGGGYYQGLPAVFLKNGAHSVVSSLVPIFDEHTREFAVTFYENLLCTQSVSQSLRKARKWIRDKYEAQIYWVPYIHYGPPL